MANGRDPNKRLIGAYFDIMLIARIDKARKDLREDRSVFVIRAVIERLKALGYRVPEHFEPKNIPPRTTDFSYLLKDEPLTAEELEQKRQEEARAKEEAAGLPDDLFESEPVRAVVFTDPDGHPDLAPYQVAESPEAKAAKEAHFLSQRPLGVIAAGASQETPPVRYRNAPRARKSNSEDKQ